jgi:hypothetical protein
MLEYLRLTGFKNFRRAELPLGPLTLLVGTNASGKSNLRDAFRFLHGISRGYSLAEIIGEKWIEGGVLQWRGIRGGTREATFKNARSFALEVGFTVAEKGQPRSASYRIEMSIGRIKAQVDGRIHGQLPRLDQGGPDPPGQLLGLVERRRGRAARALVTPHRGLRPGSSSAGPTTWTAYSLSTVPIRSAATGSSARSRRKARRKGRGITPARCRRPGRGRRPLP